jgi:hypothetical protein
MRVRYCENIYSSYVRQEAVEVYEPSFNSCPLILCVISYLIMCSVATHGHITSVMNKWDHLDVRNRIITPSAIE